EWTHRPSVDAGVGDRVTEQTIDIISSLSSMIDSAHFPGPSNEGTWTFKISASKIVPTMNGRVRLADWPRCPYWLSQASRSPQTWLTKENREGKPAPSSLVATRKPRVLAAQSLGKDLSL